MRYREIIAEEIGDTWEKRHAAFQRKQTKSTKLRRKLDDAQRQAADQARTAAAQRAKSSGKLDDIKADLAAAPET